MSESARLVDGSREPTPAEVAGFIGKQNAARWASLTRSIAARYPGVFNVEWLYGGKKHGWTLRFKKSKSFCSLVPERRRFKVLLVFGGAEREKVERLLPALVSHVRKDYVEGPTYPDGKWVLVTVDSAKVLSDVERLLALKRPPKPAREGREAAGGRVNAPRTKPRTIDDYLAGLPRDKRAALEGIRKAVRAVAPGAEECFSYGLPAFRLDGKVLVGFGAASGHCAFYPMSGTTVARHREELSGYDTSKGTIRFSPEAALPGALIRKLVRSRVEDIRRT